MDQEKMSPNSKKSEVNEEEKIDFRKNEIKKMIENNQLEGKKVSELKEIAKELGEKSNGKKEGLV